MMGLYNAYVKKLETVLDNFDWEIVHQLTLSLQEAWRTKNTVFLCGNGGSAGNAIHIVNDFNYGIEKNWWYRSSCGSLGCQCIGSNLFG